MNYDDLNNLYKNNEFRKIDKESNSKKFYLLRSISKADTIKKFCEVYSVERDLNKILDNKKITEKNIIDFIKNKFTPKSQNEINLIEAELNKLQSFDWGGSNGNSLERNIVDNYVKKISKYEDIEDAIAGNIHTSARGYTLNSWYNHWSTILIEDIFKRNERVLPTIGLIKNIDFFIDSIPFDLKVTYFPEELMKKSIANELNIKYGSKSELTCAKRIAREVNISIPSELKEKDLILYLNRILRESVEDKAKKFIKDLNQMKSKTIEYYKNKPEELIIWLYEHQGNARFDAANRFYLILIDSENIYESWKLKRNSNLLKKEIYRNLKDFDRDKLRTINFHWDRDGKDYNCISEMLFIIK